MRWAATLMFILGGCGMEAREKAFEAADGPTERVLSAADLYRGLEATRVLLKDDALVLDTRNWRTTSRGRAVTDVIDLAGDGVMGTPVTVSDLTMTLDARTPDNTDVTAQVRTGTTFFQAEETWTEWCAPEAVQQPRGRYIQVRLTFTTKDPTITPALKSLTIFYTVTRSAVGGGDVALVTETVQRIVRSPITFGYERPDQPDLVWLRKTFKLDEVIAGKKGEFEQLRALMRWVVTRPNKRSSDWRGGGPYPWHIRKVLKEEDGGTVYGHCMSYCQVMITAANAFGWQGRHWAIHGFRDTSHEVPEIWLNELGKWVFFDPSLDTYYTDKKTREPLNLLQMHNIYVNFVLKEGEVLRRGRTVNVERVEALRGKHPIRCVSGDWGYGKPWKWDWEYRHGYMTAGWLQLTPRNNWHSQPKPIHRHFGHGPDGYEGFPLWSDERTPLPTPSARNWYTRKRDFWWTLNQASFRLVRSGPSTLAVECGNSQPFFKRYLARMDGGEWKEVGSRFTWTLDRGTNRLEVTCEDEFGKRGLSSVAAVKYEP